LNEQDPKKLLDASLDDLEYVLSRFELRAVPFLLSFAEFQPGKVIEVLVHAGTARVAPLMAEAHFRMKKAGAAARKWLVTFPEHAAAGLIPLAIGADKKKAAMARGAIRVVAQNGHEAIVRSVSEKYGAAACTAIQALLALDPLDDVPAKLPKAPDWLDVKRLPRPVMRDTRRVLPLSAASNLLAMLQFTAVDPPYVGITRVKEACDAESLAEFAWALFSEWLLAGAVGKDDWALTALGHLGTDETARRLGPKIRAWPGEAANARAVKGLDVLAAIGSDIALMHLDGIAQKLKFKGLQEKAKKKIAEIAESRNLTREELADRLVPDLDLDDDGSKVLDFGERTFRVGFDEHLSPFVLDAAAKRQKDLPKPNKSDDAEKAAIATRWWKAVKKDAKAISRQQILRLELAMCARRTWDVATFRTFMLDHPLMVHPLRRLVWATYADGAIDKTFRVAEDRSLADVDDATFVLPESATLGIAHRLDLGDVLAEK
jgi:hypothetical protein